MKPICLLSNFGSYIVDA